jgi:hypothetical protein
MMDPASAVASSSVNTAAIVNSAVTSAKLATGAAAGNLAAGDVTPTMLSQKLTQMTSQASTSGTSIDFTSIPSWVKRITVMFNGVSTNGASHMQVQVGSGSVQTTGYTSMSLSASSTGAASATSTAGFAMYNTAADVKIGHMVLTLISGNTWIASHAMQELSTNSIAGGGTVALSGALDRVRITTVNGTDTFDAGSVNIMYE